MNEPVLDLEKLTIALPPGADRAHAVSDVDLTWRAGKVTCLIGESGLEGGMEGLAERLKRGAVALRRRGVGVAGKRRLDPAQVQLRRERRAVVG